MNFKIYYHTRVLASGHIEDGNHQKYVAAFIKMNNYHSAIYKEYPNSPPGYLIQTTPGKLTANNTMVFLLEG